MYASLNQFFTFFGTCILLVDLHIRYTVKSRCDSLPTKKMNKFTAIWHRLKWFKERLWPWKVNASAYPCCSTHHRTSLDCLSKIKIAIVYQILFYIYKIHWTYVLYIDNLWCSWIMCSVPPGFGLSHVPGPLVCLKRCLNRGVLQMRQQITADVAR